VWLDGDKRTWIVLGLAGGVRAYRVETDAHGRTRLVHAWSANAGQTQEGTSPVVNNGIVFVAMNGAIVALDALSGKELWSSARNARVSIGDVHWQSPIAVDGAVYCLDQDGNLSAYGH
jgi:outer membrane protein assembly factor BamB